MILWYIVYVYIYTYVNHIDWYTDISITPCPDATCISPKSSRTASQNSPRRRRSDMGNDGQWTNRSCSTKPRTIGSSSVFLYFLDIPRRTISAKLLQISIESTCIANMMLIDDTPWITKLSSNLTFRAVARRFRRHRVIEEWITAVKQWFNQSHRIHVWYIC